MAALENKILKRKAKIAVVGLGYVGLPLAIEFAEAGFSVTGIEADPGRRQKLAHCKSYINDVTDDELRKVLGAGKLRVSGSNLALENADAVFICVPTPLDRNKQPDLSCVKEVACNLSRVLRREQVVILESTTYPGTTEEVLRPILERSGLKAGKDFHLAFSPERIDPGNKLYKVKEITKVVGGLTPACTKITGLLYRQIIAAVHEVSSPRIAEMEKLLENIFRSVNIALVNELAILCNKMKIDIWEVIEAAKTKPYGFMSFAPGPGIGGHCIPLDPFYLSWRAKEFGVNTKFIELAGEINDHMPDHVVSMIQDSLNEDSKSLKDSKVLVLGAAYKKDIGDVRESPALKIIRKLLDKCAKVEYNDPFVPQLRLNGTTLRSVAISESKLKNADCIVIATDHSNYDYEEIIEKSKLIIDTRNATGNVRHHCAKIVRL